MMITFSPAGFEQFFVQEGIPASGESEPPVGGVQPTPEEFVRRLAPYGCEVTGPTPALEDL